MLFRLKLVYFILVLGFKGLQSYQVFIERIKFENLPRDRDLVHYSDALNSLIDFGEHKYDFDINFYFGLFLANVNLKRTLQEKKQQLPKKLHSYVNKIIQKVEKKLNYFKDITEHNHERLNSKYKGILSLFANSTPWIVRIPDFHAVDLNEPTSYLETAYTKWVSYRKYIDNRNAWVPNPHQSDLCLASLASAVKIQMGNSLKCRVLKSCYEMVENGTDFGYALAHRLLFLQQARYARGCSIFSEQEDRQMRRRFCTTAYQEVEYIARHDFEIVDLLLEHVCLCALEGYAQFLRRTWLAKILSFQTVNGCFSPRSQSNISEVAQLSDHGMNGHCNGHTTAVAAGTLATAIRFIIQFYY